MKKPLWTWILTVAAGCSGPPQTGPSLGPEQARQWLSRNPGAQLVDVRTKEEYAQGHLAGSRLIPVQELEARAGELDKEKPLMLYCRSGRRSQEAFQLLRAKGFKELLEITGGILAWTDQGLPVERPVRP